MSDPTPPKIHFPCPNYAIKIMGDSTEEFRSFAFEVIRKHASDFDPATARIRPSRNGNFEALTVKITATGTEQLTAIFEELKTNSSTKMVL